MNNKKPLQPAAEVRSRRKLAKRRAALGAAIAAAVAWPLAHAQVMRVEPAIGANVTYSTNGNQAPPGQEQADLAIEIRPEFWVSYQTARLRAYGSLAAVATTYIGGDRTGTLFPSINLGATLKVVPDFFYVDADIVASREFANPFAPRSTSGDANAYASYTYRLVPYFQGELPSLRLRYLLRNDFYWTRTGGELGDRFDEGFEWRIRGELATTGERRIDLAAQYERDYLEFSDDAPFVVEVTRAIATYRITPQLSVNARGGYEWVEFPLSESQGGIYGAGFSWRPTPRTNFTAWWEERFFGGSWLADLSHRMPWLAISLSSSRLLSYGTQSLFDVPRTNNVFRSIDAILSSRIPDPVERSRAVRDFLTITGLPFSLATPVPILSQRVDLQEANWLSVGLLGARNSLVADAYHVKREGITAEGEPLPDPFRLFTDETQRGASVTFSHRLGRNDSVNATQLWQRTEGVTLFSSGAESTQWTTRAQYNRQLAPRTTAYAGARYVKYESNVFADFDETAVFVGLYHSFR